MLSQNFSRPFHRPAHIPRVASSSSTHNLSPVMAAPYYQDVFHPPPSSYPVFILRPRSKPALQLLRSHFSPPSYHPCAKTITHSPLLCSKPFTTPVRLRTFLNVRPTIRPKSYSRTLVFWRHLLFTLISVLPIPNILGILLISSSFPFVVVFLKAHTTLFPSSPSLS